MISFLLRRLLQSVLTVLGVLTATFFLVRLSGDPTTLLLPVEATPEDVANFRTAFGLDQSWLVQYAKFLASVLEGDFGTSLRQRTSALGLVLERLPATIELALTAFILGLVLAFAIGLATRLSSSARLRSAVMWIALARQAIPVFWFGLLLILLFSVTLRWLPSLGRGTWAHLVLPAVTLATYEIALYLRLFHSSLAAEERQDYVRTAYAKGQSREQDYCQAHAAECPSAADHDRRHEPRLAARRHGRNRDRVQLARRWATDRAVGQPARLPGHHRRRVRGVSDLRRDQSRRRSPVRMARSAREAVMSRHMTITTWIALVLLGCVLLLLVVVPLLPTYDPYTQDLGSSLLPPFERLDDGRLSVFGTDKLGRDVLSRVALAGWVSLFIGLSAVAVSMVIGTVLGLTPAISAAGSRPRSWVSRTFSYPSPRAFADRGYGAIGVDDVKLDDAARPDKLGGLRPRRPRPGPVASRARICALGHHPGRDAGVEHPQALLPNVLPQVVIVGSFDLGQIIILEASLSYLGLGVQPPLPSWGLMISEGQSYLELNPWLAVIPGMALFMLVAGVQFLTQSITAEGAEERELAAKSRS